MNAVKKTLFVASLLLFVSFVQSKFFERSTHSFLTVVSLFIFLGENCTIKKVSDGVINRLVVLTCPSPESVKDAKFCCYDVFENVECCNAADRLHNLLVVCLPVAIIFTFSCYLCLFYLIHRVQKYMPSLLILLILIVGLILACCVICICIPCYCMMRRRRPAYSTYYR